MANDQNEITFGADDFQPVGHEVAITPSAFQPLDDKPAPPELQTQGLAMPSNASIGAYQPSVWERIGNIFTEGIPQFSHRTVYNPKFGEQQFITPEAAMTPLEQRRHPIVTGASEVAGGPTSPQTLAILAATSGLGYFPAP